MFIAAVSPMDKHGYFTIPLCISHERTFLAAAKKVIVQVNPQSAPGPGGDTALHIRDVDMIVEAATRCPYLPKSQPTQVDQAIGQSCGQPGQRQGTPSSWVSAASPTPPPCPDGQA